MKFPFITNIQKYAIHDGDGIRTTVFFKGCPLACRWCHNPETHDYRPELMYVEERCTGCGRCIHMCPARAITYCGHKVQTDRILCTRCGTCAEECFSEARTLSGKQYAVKELVRELEKDAAFSEVSGGGITLSGGEALAQDIDYMEALLCTLHARGHSVYMDTCGYLPYSVLERALPYVDTFLYDIKLMDSEKHRQYTGAGNELILANLCRLSEQGARIYLRLPLIQGVNDSAADCMQLIRFVRAHNIQPAQINLLPYHALGQEKYARLDKENCDVGFAAPEPMHLEKLQKLWMQHGFGNVKIGG